MQPLDKLRPALKNLLLEEGLGPAIEAFKAALPEDSKAFNDVLLLEAELKETNKKRVRGSLSQDELDAKYSELRERMIALIDNIEERDLEAAAAGKSAKEGSLLYQIPTQMELEKETRCRVRIAYDDDTLLENIELTADTKVQDVRIAEVMEVQLIDPNETPAFAIRTFNREEQFIEKDAYTEWIFFVKPILEGKYPLFLRVSVIEQVGEKERVRDIVLEEMVVIVSEPVSEDGEAFKSSGVTVGGEEAAAGTKPAAVVAGGKAEKKKKRGALGQQRGLLGVASLVAFSAIAFAAVPSLRMQLNYWATSAKNDPVEYREFAERHPKAELAEEALIEAERLTWESLEGDTSLANLEDYLALYPNGPHAGEIIERLASRPYQVNLQESTLQAIQEYLDQNPQGTYAELARGLLPGDSDPSVAPSRMADNSLEDPESKPDAIRPATPESESLADEVRPATPESAPEKEVKPPPPPAAPDTEIPIPAPNTMVAVTGGTFTMGCTREQRSVCHEIERPRHEVTLPDFLISKYEVTNAEYCVFLNETEKDSKINSRWIDLESSECQIEKSADGYVPKAGYERHPVIMVSWLGATAFCEWLSERNNKTYRLPSEPEWEYAARGGQQAERSLYAGSSSLTETGWFAGNSGSNPHPIGQKAPNELGLYDMSGNVWEWCMDPWHPNYDDAPSDGTAWKKGGNQSLRIVRGGSFKSKDWYCRVSYRGRDDKTERTSNVGFRIVQE
jgi:sulfatase modifying factor 1